MDSTTKLTRCRSWRTSPEIDRFHSHLRKDRNYAEKLIKEKVRGGERMKIIVSGPIIERFQYQFPVKVGKRQQYIDPDTGEINPRANPEKDRKDEAKRTNSRRSKNELRRLVLSNFVNMDKFITLTFKDGAVKDVTNVRECNDVFNLFIKRLRTRYGSFKFCRVIEFQKRGAVHYHCIMELPYVPYEMLTKCWGHGGVDIEAIDHVDNVGAYVQKYMAKDFNDPRLAGVKAFTTSHNLTRPVVHYGTSAKAINETLAQKKEVFANSYESEYQGLIQYTEYNLNRE